MQLARNIDAYLAIVVNDVVGNHLAFFGYLAVAAPHESFYRINGVLGVRDHLVLGGLADDAVALRGKSDNGRSRALSFSVLDDYRLAAFHDGYARVRGA